MNPTVFLSLKECRSPGEKGTLEAKQGKKKILSVPLTKKDILRAGEELFKRELGAWIFASSVDHPSEYGCRLDVRGLLTAGFIKMQAAEDKMKVMLLRKIIDAVNTPVFRGILNAAETAAFNAQIKELEAFEKQYIADQESSPVVEKAKAKTSRSNRRQNM